MAKYKQGTVVGAGGFDQVFQLLRAHLTNNGWTEHDVLSDGSGNRDVVFRGSALDAVADNRPFFRLKNSSPGSNYFLTRGYVDWDPAAHAGIMEFGSDIHGWRPEPGDNTYFFRANGFAVWAAVRGGVGTDPMNRFYAGFAARRLRAEVGGITRTTSNQTYGDRVFPVASDMAGKLYVGQRVLVISYAHDSSSELQNNIALLVIESIAPTAITFTAASRAASPLPFDSGAVIGENPIPCVLGNSANDSPKRDWYPFSQAISPWDGALAASPGFTLAKYSTQFAPTVPGIVEPVRRPLHLSHLSIPNAYAGNGTRCGYLYHVNPVSKLDLGAGWPENVVDARTGATFVLIGGAGTSYPAAVDEGFVDAVGPRVGDEADTSVLDVDLHPIDTDTDSGVAAGSGPDATVPVVSDVTPAAGTPLEVDEPIAFKVTDSSSNLTQSTVLASYPDLALFEVVYFAGAFAPFYSGTRTAIANGFQFSNVIRRGGWPAAPTFIADAIDDAGNRSA